MHARTIVMLASVAVITACAGTQIPKDRITDPGEMLFNGQVRSNVNCYSCHNGDASGTWRGPNLAKPVPGMSDHEIVETIDDGPGLMPSFKDKLSAPEKLAIATWLHRRFPPKATAH